MTYRLTIGLMLMSTTMTLSADPSTDAAKKGLQNLGEFVGEWDVSTSQVGKKAIWKESLSWGWKFQGADSWLQLEIPKGKFISKGKLTYHPDSKTYKLILTDAAEKTREYTGKITRNRLMLESTDSKSADKHRLSLFTLADGARMVVVSELQEGGKGLFEKIIEITATKRGESLAGGSRKKNECIVTGGLGTITVSHMGKTYYVCCSGCRDEFVANPQKYIDEYEKSRKKS